MAYWLLKYIFLGPLLAILGRPKIEGLEYVRSPVRRFWPATIWR